MSGCVNITKLKPIDVRTIGEGGLLRLYGL